MLIGDPKDMNQEGIFDKVESLDLNYNQAAVLLIAIDRQINESIKATDYFTQLRADVIDQHEVLTPELVKDELEIHTNILENLKQIFDNLKEVTQMLEPTDELVKPKTS